MSALAQMSFHALPLSSSLLTSRCCPHRWFPPCCCLTTVVLIAVASLFLSSTLLSCCCCLITVVLLHLPHLCGLNVSVMVPVLPPCHCFDRIRSVGQEYQRNWDVPDSLPPVHDNGNQTLTRIQINGIPQFFHLLFPLLSLPLCLSLSRFCYYCCCYSAGASAVAGDTDDVTSSILFVLSISSG